MIANPQTKPAGETAGTKAAVQANPFTKASRRTTEPFADVSRTLGASAQTVQQIDVPAGGYLRHIVLHVALSGYTGATYKADAPFNVIESVQLSDVNGQPIVQLSGFDLYLANLAGGYAGNVDPKSLPGYSATATAAGFQLRIPVEVVQRNALGALANMNAAMTYKVKLSLAPQADVFSAITGNATVQVKAIAEQWANPQATDLNGVPNTVAPPALGTTQNWSEYVAPVVVGANTIRLPRVGNTVRNLIFVNRDATGARTDAGIPAELSLLIDGSQWKRNSFSYESQRWFELYGTARPAGVWVLPLTDDFDGTPGEEIGDYWLPTTGATRLELQGVFTAAGSLMVMTNDILAFAGNGGAGQTLGA